MSLDRIRRNCQTEQLYFMAVMGKVDKGERMLQKIGKEHEFPALPTQIGPWTESEKNAWERQRDILPSNSHGSFVGVIIMPISGKEIEVYEGHVS